MRSFNVSGEVAGASPLFGCLSKRVPSGRMAPAGHTAPQCPQPIHQSFLATTAFSSVISRTKLGQMATHFLQPIQSFVITTGGFPFPFIILVPFPFPKIDASRVIKTKSNSLNHTMFVEFGRMYNASPHPFYVQRFTFHASRLTIKGIKTSL